MIVNFQKKELLKWYSTPLSMITGKLPFDKSIIERFKHVVDILKCASSLQELKSYHSLGFEKLKGDRANQYAVRLNKKYRLIFVVNDMKQLSIMVVEIVDYH